MTSLPSELNPLILSGEYKRLFIDKLGWDFGSKHPPVSLDLGDGHNHALPIVAEKRGMAILSHLGLPDKKMRREISKGVSRYHFEHLIIFHSADFKEQIWLWPKNHYDLKKGNQQRVIREVSSITGAHDLSQRLAQISINFEEEPGLLLADVTARMGKAFDVEKVTKAFYGRFKCELDNFTAFIEGLDDIGARQWYASLTLNRLMFIYFIQKKGFLNDDVHYLSHKLDEVKETGRDDEFHTFYRIFLRRLFHEGLGLPLDGRQSDLAELLGNVPYLNGGLFEEHELEASNENLNIPDEAFEKLFEFFDQYQWHLDNRPLSSDHEINPDILGHIFEKYINQKEMGAYYTKEDITGYISRNTIIPWLLEQLDSSDRKGLWELLQDFPEDWLYPEMLLGCKVPLPDDIAAGLNEVSLRGGWNASINNSEIGLPSETWREHVARRGRVDEILAKLQAGKIREISDLITYNLDVEKLAGEFISNLQSPTLLKKFWDKLNGVTVLDPTCGSGAFLFAALNILAPLYALALEKMQDFVGAEENQKKLKDFRDIIGEIQKHPNQNYFVLKRIIMNNLYGVDIMKEAVEICKLRLFLKLAAQLTTADQIEPLPDVDFNIKAGNTLIGYVTAEEIEVGTGTLGLTTKGEVDDILAKAEQADTAYKRFQDFQVAERQNDDTLADTKQELRKRLDDLRRSLDGYLAPSYKVNPDQIDEFSQWRENHQPFHWLSEFYGIISKGGFDAIIGNPPYKALSVADSRQFLTYVAVNSYLDTNFAY